ncbi:hypothetical protein H2204_007160 [Knufia peltigerae]|uniref:Uncharacterized protein n=1 Tax=Knufia peltigerae TaxID=1002370 RepID=A0AA38Y291_9EURO|nr:hypothetical protein H2204_007160 [Knufia peltigerae]
MFWPADATATTNSKLATLKGTVDVIHMSAVLHQWPWETQVQAARVVVSFSKPGTVVVVGYQIGNVNAGVVSDRPGITRFDSGGTTRRVRRGCGKREVD